MAGDTIITVVGNLTADPELRFTPSGAAVANFTVASTPRMFDRQTNEWKDGEALFLRCNVWRQAAENVAESLTRGARVVVTGRLKQRSFETKEGEKRTVIELEVDEIGPSLRYATAKVNKVSRGSGGGDFGGGGFGAAVAAVAVAAVATAAAAATTRGGPRRRPAPARARTTSRPSRPFPDLPDGALTHGEGATAQAEEEGLRVLQGQDGLHRLQGHRAAAEVHLRPGQDPRPAGDRQLQPAPA
jgi:single-strand DNA-binding protein